MKIDERFKRWGIVLIGEEEEEEEEEEEAMEKGLKEKEE